MRVIGVDIGKVSFKAVWLDNGQRIKETFWQVHQQEFEKIWQRLKTEWQITGKDLIIVTGRLRQILDFPQVVEKVAQEEATRFLYPDQDISVVKLGGGGFSVLKVKTSGASEFRRNPRCAAGVGSFLDQIFARVGLDLPKADQKAEGVKGLEITSRCGVTMKTDFTHLLNQGHKIKEVVAGLLDSSAKNAVALALKTEISPQVIVIGGLSASKRIIRTIQGIFEGLSPRVRVEAPPQALYFEALGAALVGARMSKDKDFSLPQNKAQVSPLVYLPGLKNYLNLVNKIRPPEFKEDSLESLIMGLDIGSTGSKLVILSHKGPVFEAYTETKGQPVQAAKDLVQQIPARYLRVIKAIGCTGSGREIVGNLLKSSLPEGNQEQIFVLNEIAAHAQGAFYYDNEVDTVVDIGGQDAKFIRLEAGRVIDSCMNTVCSAGTGSFLAEQLQLLGINDVRQLGQMALESPRLVELGQYCAVFISEQIDDVKRKGATLEEITAGLYYSIILNYNNRVKGLRDYGQKIFLQGKPAENLSLACALAKVTGRRIIVPPSPGSMGALGIAILTKKEFGEDLVYKPPLDLRRFLESYVLEKKEFRCRSREGCLEGNLCSIQMITVRTVKEERKFFWGGACDKYEKTGKSPILAQAPRPFLERERLILRLIVDSKKSAKPRRMFTIQQGKTIGIPRGLETEEILPLVITFFQELGFKVERAEAAGLQSLEQGAKLCQSAFCAPLQLLAGEAKFLEDKDFVFLPKVIEITGREEKRCYVCSLSQAMPDLFSPKISTRVLQPLLNFKEGYEKTRWEFLKLGLRLGSSPLKSLSAFKKAVKAQREFEEHLARIGEESIRFAKEHLLPVVVVLGHPYIVHSSLLAAGIPETIQEKGAIALPADCYPLAGQSPVLGDIYWGYGHRLLKVAYEIRKQPGIYPLWLSVYSCGPDSFLIHFFQYLSQGKPYAVLETDAYTGQAGFKTRVEAFLYGIRNYQQPQREQLFDINHFEIRGDSLTEVKGTKSKILFPWMGEGTRIAPACIRALGVDSEVLPMADEECLKIGRLYTSGKECLPMIVTLGSLLKYSKIHQEDFYYFMPRAGGPCRFGQYQLLTKIILEKLGLAERIKVLSPTSETGYRLGEEAGGAIMAKFWSAVVFTDLLKDALFDLRPEEEISGSTQEVFDHYLKKSEEMISKTPNDWSGLDDLWGMKSLAFQAASDFQKIARDRTKQGKPKVLLTGEIYVRLDDFSNNNIIRELEDLNVKVKLAPFREWINYTTWQRLKRLTLVKTRRRKVYLTWFLQRMIEKRLYKIFAKSLDWPEDHKIEEILKTAKPYLRRLRPLGEAALTIGLPLLLWQKREIAGAVIVGPFECMPTRIAETQLSLISQHTGLPVLTLSFNGDPLEKDLLESFIWDLSRAD
ncbi:MAG: acyl-CoA dehydratase activase [Nitrospirota bacterium]